jgi:S-(hydroxymethyl)glutathione dehydrogenase/alcohol dehydrogenase
VSFAPARLQGEGVVLGRVGETPRLRELEFLPPGRMEVRIKMTSAGVCHTDLAAIRDARTTPLLLGHEGVGEIESIGDDVQGLSAGDRVLLSWRTPCGHCRSCARAQPHLCLQPRTTSEPRVLADGAPISPLLESGCFASYVVVPAGGLAKLPEGLDGATAALVGCAVATGVGAVLHTAAVQAGDDVAVWGAGGVGLNVVLAAATLARARSIIVIDPDPQRRDAALRRGATVVATPEESSAAVAEATAGRGVDHAFEVVGDPSIMREAIDALAVGGQLTLVGAAARDAQLRFEPRRFMSRQQRIVGCIYGSLRPAADLPLLLEWCRAGVIPLDDLIGERLTLADLPSLFERPSSGVRPLVEFP